MPHSIFSVLFAGLVCWSCGSFATIAEVHVNESIALSCTSYSEPEN